MASWFGRILLSIAGLSACARAGFFSPPLETAANADGFGDGDTSDLDASDADSAPAVEVSTLFALWTTANQIRWTWTSIGDGTALASFELVTATAQNDLSTRSGTARVWTASDNPELGVFELPGTSGYDPVVATTTDLLAPDTTYYAQINARDVNGRVSSTNVASAQTHVAPTSEIVVFSEADMLGYSLPSWFTRASNDPYSGTYHYEYVSACPAPATSCWENLRRQNLGLSVASMSAADFDDAFFEFAIATDSSPPYWTETSLSVAPGSADYIYMYTAWTLRATDEYQLIQVPLRVLTGTNGPFTYAILAPGLFGFRVGAEWDAGSVTRIDEVRLRW